MVVHAWNPRIWELRVGPSEFKVILGYSVSLRPCWVTWDPISKNVGWREEERKKDKEINLTVSLYKFLIWNFRTPWNYIENSIQAWAYSVNTFFSRKIAQCFQRGIKTPKDWQSLLFAVYKCLSTLNMFQERTCLHKLISKIQNSSQILHLQTP